MHIEHARFDPARRELLRRLYRKAHGVAVGDYRDVTAAAQQLCLADLELVALAVNARDRVSCEAQVYRAVKLCRSADQLPCRPIVRGHDDRHIRYGAQDAHILDGLMAGAVICGSDPAVGAGYLDIQVRVAYLLTDHLQHAHGAKGRIGHDKRYLPAGGKPCRSACAVLLRNAHVKVLLRQRLAERARLAGFAYISIHNKYVSVLFAELNDLVAEAVSCGYILTKVHIQSSSAADIFFVKLRHCLLILLLIGGSAMP